MVDAFWKTGQFAQLLSAVREQRAKQSAINNYASTFTQAVNKSKTEKPPVDPNKKALFDWGQRTYGVKIPTQTVDPALRLDDRKQALLHNQFFADKRVADSIEQARISAWQRDQTFKSQQVKKDVLTGKIEKPAGQTFEEWNQARLEEENALAASIKFDPELKPGDKLYLDYKQNVVTNKPTELELFKYMGVYIPVERNKAGNLSYPEGYEDLVIDMTKLQDATYTPEVDIFLRGLESKYETAKPPTFASNIQPTGTPAYLNVLTNEITNDQTQIPLYWDQDTKQVTQFEENYKGEKNSPVVLNQETLDSLGTGLQQAMQVYIANEQNADWGVGSNPAAVSMIAPIVTRENVLDGVTVRFPSATNQQETQTVNLDPVTNAPTFLEKFPEKPEFIRNLPEPLSNGLAANIFSATWWEVMWGGNVTKQLMNTPTSKFMSKPILGTVSLNTVMAGAGVGFTLLYNIPTTLVRQTTWLFGNEKAGEDLNNSWENFEDKLSVLRQSYNMDKAKSINKNETKTNQIDEARATTQSISEELVKWRSGTVKGWDKLSDQQKVTRIADLEAQWEKSLEYEAALNKLQADTIGKFSEQAGYSAQYYRAGNLPVATAELAYGYEKLYEGADWNLAKQYAGSVKEHMFTPNLLDLQNRGRIPQEQIHFMLGVRGMSEPEISSFEQFINSGYVTSNILSNVDNDTKASMQRNQTTTVLGANMLFLQDVAKKSIETGRTMTTAEQYDYLVDEWLPKYLYNSATNPKRLENTYYNTNQQLTADMANTMFQQLQVSNNYLAMASQYEEGSPEQQEVLNNAKTWMDEAYRLGDRVIEYHSRSGNLNPYAAWTYNLSEEKKNEFRKNVVEAMFQAGRLLSMEEITQISYITQDPALEMLGEIFLDVNNLALPIVAGLSKSLIKSLGRVAMKVPFIGKSATAISNNTIVKTLLDRSVQTVASKQGKAATNIFWSVAQTKPATESEFVKQVSNIAAWAKQATTVTDELTEGAAKLLKETPFRGVPPTISAQESLIQLARTIDPDEWAGIAAKAWEATHEFYVKGVTKQILSQNPGKLISDPVIANNISDAVERLVASYRGTSRLGQEFGEAFRQTSLRGNLVKLGSNLVPKDTIYGAIAQKYGTTRAGQLLGGIAEVQSRFMKAWIWATLARRPAWAIFNFVDNTFRYTMASIRYGGQFGDDMKAMLKMYGDTEGVMKTVKQGQYNVKAEIESSGLMSLTDEAFTKAASMGIDKNMLSQNPLSFLSYYKSFVQINGTGKNLLGKVLGTFTAFPASIKALNNSIEMGMKTMMYIRFYEKNIAKMNHLFLTDVISHLSEVVQAKGLSAIEADMIQKHVLNSINSSGGNAAKLYDLLRHNRVDPKLSGYNIYIPESLRNAEWFDEAAQRAFLYDVTTRFQKFQARLAKSNVKEILPEHLDQFFDETLSVLQAESNMIVQGMNRDYSIVTGAEIGSNGEQVKAARYSKSIEKELKGVDKDTADFLKNLDDSKPFDRKTKGKIKKYLQDNDIKFEDTDEGLKDGLAKLRAKRDEYPDSQPRAATPEELKAIDENKEGVLTNSEELTGWDANVHSADDKVSGKWNERALWESKTHEAIAQIENVKGFSGLTPAELTKLQSIAKGMLDRTNNISSRVNKFFREVYPGPGMINNKARWEDYYARVINQLDNRIGYQNAEVLVPLQNGTLKATADVNMEDILQLSGIELLYDTDGMITSFRAINPFSGKPELVENTVFVNQLKRRLGINTKADARRGLVDDYFKIKGQAPVGEMERINIAYSLKVPEVRPLETMVADDVRLDLAIREGRNQDAAVLLAEKFQFPLMYEKGGQLLPNYAHLLNKAKKELGLKGDDAIKTLNDIKPEDLYKVLKNWYETTTGVTLASIKGNLKEGMVKAISNIFNTPTNIAEGIFETYNRLALTIGKHMGGKSEAEVWQDVLYGVMKAGDSGAVDVVRATDTLFWFNTEVRNYVTNLVGNGKVVKGIKRPITKAELLKALKKRFNQERLESSGVLELLAGTGKVTREQIIKALDENERFIVSVPRGKTKEWQINILDYNHSNRANITADLVSEELADGNIAIGLKVKSMAGDLDERSKQRLLRWAAENQYSFIEFSPSQIERFPTITVQGVFAEGTYGITSFIKGELDKQQAIIRGFTNANPTTAMEELFHAFEPFLPAEHYKVLDEWAGKIAKKQMKANPNIGLPFDNLKSEVMAKGFQKHVVTGKGVPKDIAEIFDTMRNTMLAIYRKMKDWFAGIEVTPEVEQVFNKMLDADYVAERVKNVPKPKRSQKPLYQQVGDTEGKRIVDPFYLKSADIVNRLVPEKTTAGKVGAILKNNIKKEEYEWLGLNDFLKGKDKVTKQEMLDYIKQNNVEIVEIKKGDWRGADHELQSNISKRVDVLFEHTEATGRAAGVSDVEARAAVESFVKSSDADVALEVNSIARIYPDLKNYEPLIKAREVWKRISRTAKVPTTFESLTIPGGKNYRELLLTLPELEPQFFVEQHWGDIPNVFGHIRMQEFADVDGKRVLFIEEIQSDLHQKGRKLGYGKPLTEHPQVKLEDFEIVPSMYGRYRIALPHNGSQWEIFMDTADGTPAGWINLVDDMVYDTPREAVDGLNTYFKGITLRDWNRGISGIPNAPFKDTWEELALKRITRLASEEGYDRVAWTTGKMQADRYALTNYVDEISYKKNANGNYTIYAKPKNSQTAIDNIAGQDMSNVPPERIEEFVGGDMAKRILNGEGKEGLNANFETIKVFDELDLQVGEKWPFEVYDKNIPNKAEKIIKRWNSKIEDVELSGTTPTVGGLYIMPNVDNTGWVVASDQTGVWLGTFATRKEAIEEMNRLHKVVVKGFDVTPEMQKATLFEGQSLFQKIDTPQFNTWFTWDWISNKPGDVPSWVSTKDGTPIMVKTAMADIFDEFQMDFMNTASKYGRLPYFTESAVEADSYFLRNGERGAVEDFYLSIQNPWDMDELVPWARIDEINSVLERNGYRKITFARDMYGKDAYNEFVSILDGSGLAAPKDELNKLLKKAGYDGITFMHGSLNGTTPHRVWAIFDYAQGKSFNNRGAWSISDNKFLFQKVESPDDYKWLSDIFKPADDIASNPEMWAKTMLSTVDSLFYDLDTTLFKYPAKLKKHIITIGAAEFNVIEKTFGLDAAKDYVKQFAEVISDAAGTFPVAHVQPGKFVVSFSTDKEIGSFMGILTKKIEHEPIHLKVEDELWSIQPGILTGYGLDLKEAYEDLLVNLGMDEQFAVEKWFLQNGLDKDLFSDQLKFGEMFGSNELALYPNIRKGSSVLDMDTRPKLFTVHNITMEKLQKALELGGLPMPSMAVLREKYPWFEGYGEITLVGNRNMIDPAIDVKNRIFDADIYSPRMPRTVNSFVPAVDKSQIMKKLDEVAKINQTGLKKIQEVRPNYTLHDMSNDNIEWIVDTKKRDMIVSLLDNTTTRFGWLQENYPELIKANPINPDESYWVYETTHKIFRDDNDVDSEFIDWVNNTLDSMFMEVRTFNWNGQEYEATLENLLAYFLTQRKRGGEFMKPGTPNYLGSEAHVRAMGAKEFKSIDEMKDAAENIVDGTAMHNFIRTEQYKRVKLAENAFDAWLYANGVKSETPMNFLAILGNYGEEGKLTKQSMKEWIENATDFSFVVYGTSKPSIPDTVIDQMMDAWKAITVDTPTTYFEFKPDRIVNFKEFSGAVVPTNTPDEIVEALEKLGLRVEFYNTGLTADSRVEAIKDFFSTDGVLFQKVNAQNDELGNEAWKAFVQSPIFDYGENKVSLQDMWLAFFESEEKLYKAGAAGFSAYAARVAQQLEDAGSLPMAEVFKELSEMTKNFDNFIQNKISRLDPLFPTDALTGSPIPLWKTSEAMRGWVSNKFMVGSQWYQQDKAIKLWKSTTKGGKEVTEWGRAGMTLDEWRKNQKGNLGSLMNQTEITTSVRETLDDVADYTFKSKNQMDEVANYGGEYKGVQIEKNAGAVKRTNSIMMDYSDNSVLLQELKSIFPFISYPAKSVGYWMDLMTSHPELIAFYYKYQHFTDATAVQSGALSSNGEVLPSLKGYMPLMDGLWFNPLAPLFYRFAFPRMANIRETDEELTPSQHVAKFLLDDAPVLGFNVGPIPSQILMALSGYETYYPKPTLVSEAVRTVFPIDFLPPVFERWMVSKLRKTFVGGIFGKDFLFPEETLLPRVNWADYLIEKQLLTDALMRMDTMDDPKEKLDYAKTIKGILGNPNREEDQMWMDARNKMETDQYYRTMMGHMTGLYTKDFSDGQLRLQEVRDEINVLKASIENQTLANLFGLSGDAEQRYEDYKQYKFETPEGYFWSAIQLSRYVVDPETEQQLVGQERRDEMARQYNIEEQTSMFFTAIKEAKQRYEDKLGAINIGDKESKTELYKEYQLELAAINDNPDYAMANTESFLGYKPSSRIYKDLVDRFWYQVIATKPSMIEGEEYEVYVDRVDEWKKEISNISSVTVPILELSIINKIMESGVKIDERMKEVPVWMAQIKQQANAEGFGTWEKNKDTIVDAHWKYWEQVIFQPYMDGLKGLNMYDSQLYKMNWEAGYREPTKEEVIAWIQKEYGKTKFTAAEIAAEVGNVGYIKPEDRLVSGKNEIEKSIGDVYEIIASAGPSVGEDYKNFMKAFKALGGTDEEWDRFYYAGDNIELWKDVDEYTEFLRKVKLAALKAEIPPASKERLEEFSQVRKENDQFRLDVEKQLGNDVWDLMGEYYDLSTAERAVYRKENPDEYYKISQYYTLKDVYATEHQLWASYYHPDFDGTLGSTSSGSTSGNYSAGGYSGSGGYSSSSKGYSSSYYEYKRSPLADAFLPTGKRSRQSGMDLVVYGMGKGGVTRAPWWPQELLEKLHPAAVQQIQTGQVTQAGLDYLNSVAESTPEYSKVIRDNLKLLGFGTEARKNLPMMK